MPPNLRKELGSKETIHPRRVPTARSKADGLNCTGHRHLRWAGLPNVLWRDNEVCAGSLCTQCDTAPERVGWARKQMRFERVGREVPNCELDCRVRRQGTPFHTCRPKPPGVKHAA